MVSPPSGVLSVELCLGRHAEREAERQRGRERFGAGESKAEWASEAAIGEGIGKNERKTKPQGLGLWRALMG